MRPNSVRRGRLLISCPSERQPCLDHACGCGCRCWPSETSRPDRMNPPALQMVPSSGEGFRGRPRIADLVRFLPWTRQELKATETLAVEIVIYAACGFVSPSASTFTDCQLAAWLVVCCSTMESVCCRTWIALSPPDFKPWAHTCSTRLTFLLFAATAPSSWSSTGIRRHRTTCTWSPTRTQPQPHRRWTA
jgi:hypothetical protein